MKTSGIKPSLQFTSPHYLEIAAFQNILFMVTALYLMAQYSCRQNVWKINSEYHK